MSSTQNPNFTDQPINAIDDVIRLMEEIITASQQANDPLGYFAVLYQKVTKKVKEQINNGFFDDGVRMERLVIVFAGRYFEAYVAHQKGQPVTASWQKAFDLATSYWPIVIQHILIGINAHINLDLGIAAAEISRNKDLETLSGDFNKINDILASLVDEVQQNLTFIWPPFSFILRRMGKLDNLLVDFSMEVAREGAWKFANTVFNQSANELEQLIAVRDEKVTQIGSLITQPGRFANILLGIVRMMERGSVSKKIEYLRV